MKVKICGITNLDDAFAAVEAGADALGFVFYKESPRYIDPSKAREITEALPPFVERVGLFVNETAETIDEVCRFAKMSLAQIHFEADAELFSALSVKAIPVLRAKSPEVIRGNEGKYILVDAFVESYGGEGKRLDLSWFKDVDCSQMILAGGLTAEMLGELDGYGFYGVDVSSGVEKSKGLKDRAKIQAFVKAAKNIH
jgi:phosphoribosylanthranilate isomerase